MRMDFDHFGKEALIDAAKAMAVAARTAPKARGRDQLHILILTDEDVTAMADRMAEIGKTEAIPFFVRDSDSLRRVPVLLLLGTESSPLELPHCGFCGWRDCQENRERGTNPCAFSVGDLGIAVGSAASVAAHRHVDNRVLFSAGRTAMDMGLFPSAVRLAYGLPLTATGKNPFFDRQRS